MAKFNSFLSGNKRLILWVFFLFFYAAGIAYAVPPTSYYQAGETLDPNCIPGSTDCSVLILPDQTGNSGKYLTTDGTTPSWATVSGSGTVTNVSGTANQISVATGTTTPVISIAGTYIGQTSITTLGTITTGTWNGTTIAPNHGGTGLTSLTPYAILTAGTTSTGNFQQVSGVGTSGQVLTSNGASALPTWTTKNFLIGSTSTASTETILGESLADIGTGGTDGVIYIGIGAGQNATDTGYSTFIGNDAGANSINLDGVTAIGSDAGDDIPDGGVDSIIIGEGAASSATSLYHAVVIGDQAGQLATELSSSVILGSGAGAQSAVDNVNFMGEEAGFGVTNANDSIFLGSKAGDEATNAHNSIFIGSNSVGLPFAGGAGSNATNASNSIFIGTEAGIEDTVDNTSGGSSILIGNDTSTGGFSNSIALGADATNTAANQFMLGSSSSPIDQLILNGSDAYFNFTGTGGSTGYGIRDNSGTIEFKNSGGSWAPIVAADGANNIYNSDGTLTGDRTVSLGGNVFDMQGDGGGADEFEVNPSSSTTNLTASDATAVTQFTQAGDSSGSIGFQLISLNGHGNEVDLSGDGSVGSLSMYAPGGVDISNGDLTIASLAGNGTGYVGVDNSGTISFASAPSSTNIYNTSGSLTGDRNVDLSGHELDMVDGATGTGISLSPSLNQVQLNASDGTATSEFDVLGNSGGSQVAIEGTVFDGTNIGDILVFPTYTQVDGVNTCTIANGSPSVTCSSDQRLKTNIQPLGDSLANIMALQPVTFQWSDPNKPQDTNIGFIAQQVQAIYPQFVSVVDKKNGYLGLDYAGLITPTIKALQELNLNVQDIQNLADTDGHNTFVSNLEAWFANASNHITRIFTGEICLTDPDGSTECLDKTQLGQLKQLIGADVSGSQSSSSSSGSSGSGSSSGDSSSSGNTPPSDTPPSDNTPSNDTPPSDGSSDTSTNPTITTTPDNGTTSPDDSSDALQTPPSGDDSSTTQ